MLKARLSFVVLLVVALGLSGCLSFLPFLKKADELVVTPAEVLIKVEEEKELTAVVKDKNGKELRVKPADIKWTIEDVEEAQDSNEGGSDPGQIAELLAQTGEKVMVKGLRVGEARISVSYDNLSVTVDVTVTDEDVEEPNDPEEPAGLEILFEDFSAGDTENFLSANYKSLPGEPSEPLYVKKGGNVEIVDGKLHLTGGGRFTIGMHKDHPKTSSSDYPDGRLDLSQPYRITIEITEAGDTGEFQVYVDNNATSQKDSYHGSDSRVLNILCVDLADMIVDGVAVLTMEPTVGTETSFIQVRTGSDASVVIKSIKIEYI